jgi:hypothetical protein
MDALERGGGKVEVDPSHMLRTRVDPSLMLRTRVGVEAEAGA